MKFKQFLSENNVSNLTEPNISYNDYGKSVKTAAERTEIDMKEASKILKSLGFGNVTYSKERGGPSYAPYTTHSVESGYSKIKIGNDEYDAKLICKFDYGSSSRYSTLNSMVKIMVKGSGFKNESSLEKELRKVPLVHSNVQAHVTDNYISTGVSIEDVVSGKGLNIIKKQLAMIDLEFV